MLHYAQRFRNTDISLSMAQDINFTKKKKTQILLNFHPFLKRTFCSKLKAFQVSSYELSL